MEKIVFGNLSRHKDLVSDLRGGGGGVVDRGKIASVDNSHFATFCLIFNMFTRQNKIITMILNGLISV